MTPSRLKEFDCNVLHDENGEPAAGITLFGAALGSSNYIREHSKVFGESARHPLLSQRNEKSSDRLSFTANNCASTCQYPAGTFKTSVSSLDTILLQYMTSHSTTCDAISFLDSSFSTYPSWRPLYNTCIIDSRSSIRRVCH